MKIAFDNLLALFNVKIAWCKFVEVIWIDIETVLKVYDNIYDTYVNFSCKADVVFKNSKNVKAFKH